MKLGMVAATLALVGALAVSISAFAKGNSAGPGPARQGTPAATSQGDGLGPRSSNGWGDPERSLVAVAADVLGMSQADLVAELGEKTIAQVAQEKGVAHENIVDAFLLPAWRSFGARWRLGV